MSRSGWRFDGSLLPRVIVAVVLAPVVLWVFWNGGYPLFALAALLTLLGQWEFFAMFDERFSVANPGTAFLAGLAIIGDAVLFGGVHVAGILLAALIVFFCIEIPKTGPDRVRRIMVSFLGTAYPAVFMACLFRIVRHPDVLFGADNHVLLVYLLVTIWVFDSASYFAGMFFGRHPFFPAVSPKKTVEGFAGGLAGVLVFGAAVALSFGFPLPRVLAVSVLAALAGQAGDLSESIIKRDMGVKDSSHLLPGHGGILDRFDSVFFAAPVVYGYLVLLSFLHGGGC